MADFFSEIGDALSQAATKRWDDATQWFTNPQQAATNRIRSDLELNPVTTATTQSAVGPTVAAATGQQPENPLNQVAGAGRGYVNPTTVVPEPAAGPAVPQDYNANIQKMESGNNPNIGYHNQAKSSAYGPFGTTAAGWEDARKLNPNLPADITKATPEELTAGQNAYTQQNAKYLQNYGIDVNQNTLAAAHLLGAKGLKDFQETGYLSPAAIKANGGEENLRKIVNARLGGQNAPASGAAQQPAVPQPPQPPAPVAGPATPYDMGEFAGLDKAIAQQAAANAGQPQPTSAEQQAAMEREIQRQQHFDDLNGNDTTRLLALTKNPDPAIAREASAKLTGIMKDGELRTWAKDKVETDFNNGKIPDTSRLKGEEGSYIKAYLFARLGLTDLAQQEQEKISPSKQTMPVMVGSTPYNATYSKNGELLYARDETGKLVDDATKAKIAANAVSSKNAHQAPGLISDPFGVVKGNWILETRPGGMPVFKEVGTGRVATEEESAQLSKAGQRGDILSTARTQANHATTTEYNRLAKERDARLQRGQTDEQLKPLGLDLESIQTRSQQAGQHILNAAMSNFSALPQGGRPGANAPAGGTEFKPIPSNAPAANEAPTTTTPPAKTGKGSVLDSWETFKPGETTTNYDKRTQYSKDDIEAEAQQLVSGDKTLTEITGRDAGLLRHYASARAKELDPTWSPGDSVARRDALKKWTNPDSNVSKQVRAHITAANSIDDVRGYFDALNNGNLQLANQIANSFNQKTGKEDFIRAKTGMMLLGPEIVKSIIPGGGGVSERKAAEDLVNPNLSPKQHAAAFKVLEDFQGNALKSLETDWTRAKLPKDQFRERVLADPAAQALYDRASQHQSNRAAASAGLPGAPNRADVEAEMRRRGLIK
jgi:hypothetical protein